MTVSSGGDVIGPLKDRLGDLLRSSNERPLLHGVTAHALQIHQDCRYFGLSSIWKTICRNTDPSFLQAAQFIRGSFCSSLSCATLRWLPSKSCCVGLPWLLLSGPWTSQYEPSSGRGPGSEEPWEQETLSSRSLVCL